MKIIHSIDNFLKELFPEAVDDNGIDKGKLKIILEDYYAYNGIKPSIDISDSAIEVSLDVPKISSQENDFRRLTSLSEKGRFQEAQELGKKMINNDPSNSEVYRILGQLESDQGDQSEAINYLIDALCWDPNNKWALIMMGNIFSKFKNDIDTAVKYYDQAIKVDPKNNIALNNIGATLMENRKFEEAKRYFEKALKLDPEYPNTHFAMSIIEGEQGNLTKAFDWSLNTLKNSSPKMPIYKHAFSQAIDQAQRLMKELTIDPKVNGYAAKLEKESGKEIRMEIDENLPTAAKIEIAENYERDFHLLKYKPGKPGYHHLIMHELVHLDLIIQARSKKCNKLYTTDQEAKNKFFSSYKKELHKLYKKGFSEETLAKFMGDLFDGINRQVFNTPIDLFIEDFLFSSFPELRPHQFVSLYLLNKEGVEAVTTTKGLEYIPHKILRTSKVYNIINVLHLKTLFGVDMIPDINATKVELDQAKGMYDEYFEYRQDREAGEEYELVENWGKDLRVADYFELQDESSYRSRQNPLERLTEIESDPYGLRKDPYREEEMKKFIESHTTNDINMAVTMYMVGALQKYHGKSPSEIQPVAFEIAQLGITGISPEGTGYKVASIPGVDFSGYHLLAYYYVTWKLFNPEMHKQLGLPFDKEYDLALQFYKSR